jgi:hypothetical protein
VHAQCNDEHVHEAAIADPQSMPHRTGGDCTEQQTLPFGGGCDGHSIGVG